MMTRNVLQGLIIWLKKKQELNFRDKNSSGSIVSVCQAIQHLNNMLYLRFYNSWFTPKFKSYQCTDL